MDARQRAVGQLERAQRRLAADPGCAEAWFEAAEALIVLGHERKAGEALQEGLGFAPEHARGHLRLGVLHARGGRSAKAEASFRRAVELVPGLAEAWMRLGTTLFRSGRIREAEAPLRRALELDAGL